MVYVVRGGMITGWKTPGPASHLSIVSDSVWSSRLLACYRGKVQPPIPPCGEGRGKIGRRKLSRSMCLFSCYCFPSAEASLRGNASCVKSQNHPPCLRSLSPPLPLSSREGCCDCTDKCCAGCRGGGGGQCNLRRVQ